MVLKGSTQVSETERESSTLLTVIKGEKGIGLVTSARRVTAAAAPPLRPPGLLQRASRRTPRDAHKVSMLGLPPKWAVLTKLGELSLPRFQSNMMRTP